MDLDIIESKSDGVRLRPIKLEDLCILYNYIYAEQPEWKKWNAPYFPLEYIEFEEFQNHYVQKGNEVSDEPNDRMIIQVNEKIIGTVNYYWEHKPSNWLEVGIVIYDPQYWNGGYGTTALRLWIDYLFGELPLVRVGLTTWSGNFRMMKVAEKLGMKLEGRLRKCRFYNDEYYDSIRMGVLREEWEDMK